MPPKTKYRKYAAKKRAAPRRKTVTKPSKTFAKKVNTILRANVENKQNWLTYPLSGFNSVADTSSDVLNALPFTQQGTAENQRIGDDIRAQKLTIQGHMISTMSPTLSYSRIAVRMLICQPKLTTSNTLVNSSSAQWLPYLLRTGGTNIGLNGTIESIYAPVDTDVITCYYDKVFYITQPAAYNPAGTQLAFQETVQSVKFFKVNLKLKNKLLKYNGNFSAGNYPINYSPSVLFSYVMLDGTAPFSGLDVTQLMKMTFTSCLEYEDA